ncbi:exodeoxyribonuclease V subunit beta [bacterium]|nr:exodeoxyribonuclease V subunit beta [bacterium]
MLSVKEFDLVESPLTGKNLIEASAGTGKTYAITRLFLRLLLEKDLEVDQILVVTFTEAATHELKARVRQLVYHAKEAFCRGYSEDSFMRPYMRVFKDHERACDALGLAVRNFDQAGIFTIHGFCNKILQEHAFESKSLFDTDLVSEQNELLKQIAADFWRRRLYQEPPLFVNYAVNSLSPETFLELIANKVGLRYLAVIPKVSDEDCTQVEASFAESFRQLSTDWQTAREAVTKILLQSPALNRGLYRKANMPPLIAAMDSYIASANPSPVLFKGFDKFTTQAIADGTKKDCTPPKNPFFDICEKHFENHARLDKAYSRRLIRLKAELLQYAKKELKERKQAENVLFFDDLLLNLHDAIQEDPDLASAVRRKYQAALIDEFQDTDPVQYAIFDRIFGQTDSPLFLIGDPKQAIYGFRGADIFAYIRAKNETPTHYSLSMNYRSTPQLVSAINSIFQNSAAPFVYEEIPYQPATTPEDQNQNKLRIDDDSEAAFRICYVDSSKYVDSGRPLNKKQAREFIIQAVTTEIVRILNLSRERRAYIGDRPLKEKDIAVLVRSNGEARQIQATLSELGVQSVLYSSANLFDSREASELKRILAAIIDPRKERLLKSALATQILGIRGKELFEFAQNEAGFEQWYERFSQYHRVWQRHGFMRMIKDLMSGENLLSRLMRYPDGERRITNLLHLAEVLNQAAVTKKLGMAGILKWLSEQIAAKMAPIEEHQLRLESDEQAVKLVTMHMSKGLEYPVVFCPFTWSGSVLWRGGDLKIHAETPSSELTLDLGSEDQAQNKMIAEKEELAENLRLLYVAVTRAMHRCYLFWGRFNEGPSSALAYLFHAPGMLGIEDIVTTLRTYVKGFDDDRLKSDLGKLIDSSEDKIAFEEIQTAEVQPYERETVPERLLSHREFGTKIDTSERISSYSSLVTLQAHAGEMADYDQVSLESKAAAFSRKSTSPDASDFLSFPAGAKTGNCVHSLLQNLDFKDAARGQVEQTVGSWLARFGFEQHWAPAVCDMLKKVCTVPLGVGEPHSLSQIDLSQRLNELEFYFPLKTISSKILRDLFKPLAETKFGADFSRKIQDLSFRPIKGFMKGFIDLIYRYQDRFYIVDWKSNHLGSDREAYYKEALYQPMAENLYILQYHIYVLALHQYLRQRLPNYDYEKHFGGVFYIFVRGVEPELGWQQGIFYGRPEQVMIDELSKVLVADPRAGISSH